MKAGTIKLLGVLLVGIVVGFLISKWRSGRTEGFSGGSNQPMCGSCGKSSLPCGCGANAQPICPPCVQPDLSQYVLKTTVPQAPAMPDLSQYILKSEIPPVPDLSKYVLRSSMKADTPVIFDCTKCPQVKPSCPKMSCAPCPKIMCPPPMKCDQPAPCPRVVCPVPEIKCKAVEQKIDSVRPYLAPLNMMGFGLA